MDRVWQDALNELQMEQAYRLGELAAWQHNKMEETGVCGTTELARIADAYDRAERIADTLGEPARQQFAIGYDATIDFSLNTDWREPKGRCTDAGAAQI